MEQEQELGLESYQEGGSVRRKVDLREMAMVVLQEWRIVAITVGVFLVLAIINLHVTPSVFAVRMVVMPVQGSNDQASSRMNSLSSLAQLAGLNLSPSAGQSASQFRAYLDSLRSRDLANEIAKNKTIMRATFGREWDAEAQAWRQPERTFTDIVSAPLMNLLGARPLPWTPPNGARLQDFLNGPGGIQIIQDIKRPDIASVEFDTSNPEYGIKLLNAINSAADYHLRQRALLRATQYIDYLSKELNTVTVAEHREALVQGLSEQEKFRMSASSAAPYAADLADAPYAAITRLSPKPSDVYPMAIGKGLLLGALIALMLRYFGAHISWKVRSWQPLQRLPKFIQRPLFALMTVMEAHAAPRTESR